MSQQLRTLSAGACTLNGGRWCVALSLHMTVIKKELLGVGAARTITESIALYL